MFCFGRCCSATIVSCSGGLAQEKSLPSTCELLNTIPKTEAITTTKIKKYYPKLLANIKIASMKQCGRDLLVRFILLY